MSARAREATGSYSAEQVDAVIEAWGIAQSRGMVRERRGHLASELFDIRGRTWVGFECYYHAVPGLIRRLYEHGATPESIGEAMRVPGSRPYYLQLYILMSNYLNARQERVLRDGKPPDAESAQARDDLFVVVEFFARVAKAYRTSGDLFPSEPAHDQRILGDEWIARSIELLEEPSRLPEIQRLCASLTLFNFILHGEQRDGNFDHGPYPGPDGTQLLFHEFNDLDNTYLPWAERDEPLPYSSVCAVYACRDVQMEFNEVGGCLTDPVDFLPNVVSVALFTRDGEGLRALSGEEAQDLSRRALEIQLKLYRGAVEWEQIERSRYGRYLYANHVKPFFDAAGLGASVPLITEPFEAIGNEAAQELARSGELPLLFEFFTQLDGSAMFTRLATLEESDDRE